MFPNSMIASDSESCSRNVKHPFCSIKDAEMLSVPVFLAWLE